MADGIAVTAGTGTTVATDDCGVSGHVQIIKLAFGANGDATIVGADANGLDVDVVRAPAAARTTDSIAAAHQTDAIMNGLTALTPKFAKANVAASGTDTAVVVAVTSKKIRVLSFRLHAGSTATNITFNTKPAGAGTAISELFALGANGGRAEAFNPCGHFETASGEGLSTTTGSGSTTGVGVVYVEV